MLILREELIGFDNQEEIQSSLDMDSLRLVFRVAGRPHVRVDAVVPTLRHASKCLMYPQLRTPVVKD